ncbi:hypothetical protein, partial [Psychrobacter sp.]|uniref:hypothetical protein n=1 Tax=Psychrobacter sp. TaxID=56811 RepID=UPI003F9E36C0
MSIMAMSDASILFRTPPINYALVDLEPMQYMFTESIHYNLIPSGKETAPVYDVDMQPNSLC